MKLNSNRDGKKLLAVWADPQVQAQVDLLKSFLSEKHKLSLPTSELFRKLLRDACQRAALDGTEIDREEVRI